MSGEECCCLGVAEGRSFGDREIAAILIDTGDIQAGRRQNREICSDLLLEVNESSSAAFISIIIIIIFTKAEHKDAAHTVEQ